MTQKNTPTAEATEVSQKHLDYNTNDSPKLAAALHYASMGWHVFPVNIDKEPATRNGYKEATTDETTIRQWWANNPNYNIGWWPYGSGHCVVDVDTKNGGTGFDELQALTDAHGEIPDTLTAVTPSRAQHLVFKCDTPLGNYKLSNSIDIRSYGGYVLIEPSYFIPNSKQLEKNSIEGGYVWNDWDTTWDDNPDIAELPQWVLDICLAKAEKNTKPKTNETLTYVRPKEPEEVMARFQRELNKGGKIAHRWNGGTDGLEKDTSGSARDFSLVAMLKLSGFSYSETVFVMQGFEHGGTDRNQERYWIRAWNNTTPLPDVSFDFEVDPDTGEVITAQPVQREVSEIIADAQLLDGDSPTEDICTLVREAAGINPIDRRRLWNVIKSKTGITFGVLDETLKGRDGDKDEEDHLDIARRIINAVGPDNVLAAQGFVWKWDISGLWRKSEERTVKSWAQSVLDGSGEVRKQVVESVADVFTTEIFKERHEFNVGNQECINTLSGEIELQDGQWVLTPHNREHYRTSQIPVEYDPTATAPRFEQFLKEIFPNDTDQATALLEMMGYSLMTHCKYERFIILIGTGANGKSVLLKVLEGLCGVDSIAGVQPAQFANKFQRAHLHNKLINIVSEIEQGAVIDDAALKGIVSGEQTTVEHKFKDPFQMTPYATCWFGTNHMPHTRDFSDALFRRALILKFDAVFKPELGNCDPHLVGKLEAELAGILNLALDAYKNAITNGFTMPNTSKEAREEWRMEADQVAQFVESDCVANPNQRVVTTNLYNVYKAWASENGISRTLSMKGFRDRLTRLGFGTARDSKARYVTGLHLAQNHSGINSSFNEIV